MSNNPLNPKTDMDIEPKLQEVDFDPFADGEISITAPSTDSQKEIWASIKMDNAAICAFNESISLTLEGALNVEALRGAIQDMIQRHESLRTSFSADGNKLCIAPSCNIDIPFTRTQEDSLNDIREREVTQPFNLEKGPLIRAQIVQCEEKKHILILTGHHIICDGWSMSVLLHELGKLYSARQSQQSSGLPEPERFSEYTLQEEQQSQSLEYQQTKNYWHNQFSEKIPVLDLPIDGSRPAIRTFNAARLDDAIDTLLLEGLRRIGAKYGCSFANTMLAAFSAFLYRLCHQEEIIIGISAAGQSITGKENLVGHCVNLLPLNCHINPKNSFIDHLTKLRTTLLDAYDHQNFTFGKLLKDLPLKRDPSRVPLVPVVFNIGPALEGEGLEFDGLKAKYFLYPRRYENFEIFINGIESKNKLLIECQYNTNLFSATTIQRWISDFKVFLNGITQDPNQSICKYPNLTKEDEEKLCITWNDTERDYPLDKCLHEFFEDQVQKTPEAKAIIFEDQLLTYHEFNKRANQLAHHIRKTGAEPDTLIGVYMERSIEMMISLYAILKSGAAYVPFDPEYPHGRLEYMFADSKTPILLTQKKFLNSIPQSNAKVICVDTDWNQIAEESTENPVNKGHSNNIAYVIYTSGSTGKPKGVMNTHRGIVNRLLWMQECYSLTEHDRVLQKTPISFDVSVWELFWALMVGAQIIIPRPDGHKDIGYLIEQIVKQQITTIHFVPSMLQTFLDDKDIGQCTSLKRVICSGEALSYALQRKFFQTLDTQLHNLYGPTEAAIDVCFWACQKEDKNPIVPIGRPVANTQIYILDSERQIVPIGVIGELAIGGVQVAKGYLNRPELTSEKFINDPFRPHTNAMLYRTGDLARTRSDGAIEFLGRMDHQIKIRGYRVELGEIESTILQHPLIQETAVILSHHIQNDTVLVGYIIPRANQCSEKELTADLRNFLKATLPSYMIPRIFVILESMPMFPNGKVNRQALPSPTQTESKIIEDETVAPRNNAEVLLIKIWKKVLETDQVSIHDNFFDIGGHSLLSLEVISRIYKETGIRLSPRTMLMNSLEQIAPHLIDDTSSRGIKSASLMQRILKKIKDPKP